MFIFIDSIYEAIFNFMKKIMNRRIVPNEIYPKGNRTYLLLIYYSPKDYLPMNILWPQVDLFSFPLFSKDMKEKGKIS